jgi:hypothetical protein
LVAELTWWSNKWHIHILHIWKKLWWCYSKMWTHMDAPTIQSATELSGALHVLYCNESICTSNGCTAEDILVSGNVTVQNTITSSIPRQQWIRMIMICSQMIHSEKSALGLLRRQCQQQCGSPFWQWTGTNLSSPTALGKS